ncbi:MAG: hypothetical protein HOB52_03255, partial [Euryarchaeota archaeon]|nr:hypothetical protein [Euryarchaeota archaeon]
MNSSTPSSSGASRADSDVPLIWQRGQDHFALFSKLIKQELDDETAMVEERWKKWTKQRLVAAGLTLFDLTGRPQGRFFGDYIITFESRNGERMPQHRFGNG